MTERYDNIDGLRVIACLGIIAMHIKYNAEYILPSMLTEIVASFTQFVPLFFIISGFGMFCGYYHKIKENAIDLDTFYTKRYKKILPFFITLIVIDIVITKSFDHIIEGITEATLVFGLLPNNNLDVIGVSWALGVIFLFYMIFPFVVYVCWTKKRTLFSIFASLILSLLCSYYFFTDKFVLTNFIHRQSFLYCTPYFLCGGGIYVWRKSIKSFVFNHSVVWFLMCSCLTIGYFFTPKDVPIMLKCLMIFVPWLMYAISVESKLLSSRVMKYLSGISLELYLAQMVIFRGIEKMHGLYIFGNYIVGFCVTWILVVVGLIVFIEVWKKVATFGYGVWRHISSLSCNLIL